MTSRLLRARAVLATSAVLAGLALVAVPSANASADSTAQVAVGETRDPLAWPFSRTSIWNTPIGSAAAYVPARLQAANAWYGRITADPEYISVDPTSPLKTLTVPGQAGDGAQVRVAPDLAHNGSWNGCSTVLTADGRSVWSGQPLRLTAGGTPTWTWTTQRTASDLRGDGIEGCHGGSRMSGLGGSLRTGELATAAPLRHALKVNLYCKKYCFRGGSQADSKRWPAFTADGYWATGYSGSVPALKMGALLALPPSTDLRGVTDPKARKIAEAFRDFGAYVVDDTAWDVHALDMDQRMVKSGEWPGASEPAFHAQLQQVFQQLAVVDNNTPGSVGGGGTPRAPLAPCFTGDTACAPTAAPSPPAPAPVTPPAPVVTPAPAPVVTPAPVVPAPVVTPAPVAPPTTAPPTVTPSPVAPAPVLLDPYLSALRPTSAVNGYGPYSTDLSNGEALANDGRKLTLAGRTYAKGVGVHASSALTYDLRKSYAHFTADVGVDDEVGAAGSVVFEVWADGVRRWTSPRLTGSSATSKVSLSLTGVTTLKLVVTDAGNGNVADHADWADARLWSRR